MIVPTVPAITARRNCLRCSISDRLGTTASAVVIGVSPVSSAVAVIETTASISCPRMLSVEPRKGIAPLLQISLTKAMHERLRLAATCPNNGRKYLLRVEFDLIHFHFKGRPVLLLFRSQNRSHAFS